MFLILISLKEYKNVELKLPLLTLQPLPSHTASGNLTRLISCINSPSRLQIILPQPKLNSISIWCFQSRFQFHCSSL
ncbi:hypothetical protein CHARACLAT_009872 [Characodon lateralis]|uniref:Uncharacterized protein n=1 Tax=Characodon lateralis TaxID=208331 RepID=A0ABU7EV76_9TELE|nr:hypothetical protein [Characodon lateralis]